LFERKKLCRDAANSLSILPTKRWLSGTSSGLRYQAEIRRAGLFGNCQDCRDLPWEPMLITRGTSAVCRRRRAKYFRMAREACSFPRACPKNQSCECTRDHPAHRGPTLRFRFDTAAPEHRIFLFWAAMAGSISPCIRMIDFGHARGNNKASRAMRKYFGVVGRQTASSRT